METSNQNKVINQPELLVYIIESINRFTRKYRKEHGSMPSVAEIFFHGVVNFCRKNNNDGRCPSIRKIFFVHNNRNGQGWKTVYGIQNNERI